MESVDERLKRLRSVRDEMAGALKEKIAGLERERSEALQAYDDEIATLQDELEACGVKVNGHGPSDIGVKAYNFLRENSGKPFTGSEIMSAIRSIGAVPSIVLRPFIEDGRVKTEGKMRGTRYLVEADSSGVHGMAS